jgi:hypothetical protein
MRSRGAAIQGGLAALGLLAAYTTWQREPERASGEVVVLDVNKNDLNKVRFVADEKKWVELELKKDDDGPVVWMHVAAGEAPKTPERELRGNEGALKLWEKLAPLRAQRALGIMDPAKTKELGLDAPKKHVEITAKGQKHAYVLGQPPYYVSEPYFQDENDKRVYVLGGGVLSDLESASVRLVDRTLHGFKTTEFDELTVTAGGKKRALTQQGGALDASAKIASKKTGNADDTAKNWHAKVWRLYGAEILGKGETPALGNPTVALRVDYAEKGRPRGFIEVASVTGTPPAPPAPANASPNPATPTPAAVTEYFARTEHTAGWIKLPPTAADILKEADKIAAGE